MGHNEVSNARHWSLIGILAAVLVIGLTLIVMLVMVNQPKGSLANYKADNEFAAESWCLKLRPTYLPSSELEEYAAECVAVDIDTVDFLATYDARRQQTLDCNDVRVTPDPQDTSANC